mmetsp:Transcript_36240/g.59684  ORF Transcript_36240/g.59684 Transcript_36240/m.59684 type:complete len:87 (+) Transcript_36240:106-366(+)
MQAAKVKLQADPQQQPARQEDPAALGQQVVLSAASRIWCYVGGALNRGPSLVGRPAVYQLSGMPPYTIQELIVHLMYRAATSNEHA